MTRHIKGALRRRIKPEDRPSIEFASGGDILDPRDKFAKQYAISRRTMARKLKAQTRIIAGVAYVFREASKRALAGLDEQPPRKGRVAP